MNGAVATKNPLTPIDNKGSPRKSSVFSPKTATRTKASTIHAMPPHCHLALLVESVAPADALLLIARVLLGQAHGPRPRAVRASRHGPDDHAAIGCSTCTGGQHEERVASRSRVPAI